MFALRSGFDTRQPMRDRVVDGLVIAELEMQKRMMLRRAPVTAVEAIAADQVERTGHELSLAPREDEQAAVRHSFTEQ